MGIVNAGKLPMYMDVEEGLRDLLTQVILNESDDNMECVEKLIEYAKKDKERLDAEKEASKGGNEVKKERKVDEWR